MSELKHVGIIVDGNGRWAISRNKKRSEGHLEGSKNLEKLILKISESDIKVLSLYVFSTENFKRDKNEVDYLMNLFTKWFKIINKKYKNKNIKVLFSGRKENLDKKIIKEIESLEHDTEDNTGLIVNFCLNYGGRAEIVDATKKIYNDVVNNKIDINDLDENIFSKYLYKNLPDLDLLIRTSGEQRVSNFMLWQLSYAELFFTNTLFPDFTYEEFIDIVNSYKNRDRRFGGINKK